MKAIPGVAEALGQAQIFQGALQEASNLLAALRHAMRGGTLAGNQPKP